MTRRHLDQTLATTHSHVRVFLITAKCCALAVWQDDRTRLIDKMRTQGLLSFGVLVEYFVCWWSVSRNLGFFCILTKVCFRRFEKTYRRLVIGEFVMDTQASAVKAVSWVRGLRGGLEGAHKAAAGLA